MKLFFIGDSITQGVMSFRIASGELSYAHLVSKVLGVTDYPVPVYNPLPLRPDFELLMRRIGSNENLSGVFDWGNALSLIKIILNREEKLYERGSCQLGKRRKPDHPYFTNVAIDGFQVADAWMVTPAIAKTMIEDDEASQEDNTFGSASASFYRNAYYILNPSCEEQYEEYSQLRWLQHHAENEGVERIVVMLGANNALGTIIHMESKSSEVIDGRLPHEQSLQERRPKVQKDRYNLWRPEHFRAEYTELITRLYRALAKNKYKGWKAILATVPHVTIAPLAKGVGVITDHPRGCYSKYYTYPFLTEETAAESALRLTLHEAIQIDDTIDEYNKHIKAIVEESKGRFLLYDVCESLGKLAWKRNCGNPTYELPEFLKWQTPRVNTKFYHADRKGKVIQGGVFSLDGVHPSAIGHGLIAHDLLNVLKDQDNGYAGADPGLLDWPAIWKSDTLMTRPISFMHEIYGKDGIAKFLKAPDARSSLTSLPSFLAALFRNLLA